MKYVVSSHRRLESESSFSKRIVRLEDVEEATGITVVNHLPLKERFYLVERSGRWYVFLSSLRPECHQEIIEVLLTVGRLSSLSERSELCCGKFKNDPLRLV